MLKKTIEGENDEDSLYCRSLIPIIRELPKKKGGWPKLKLASFFMTCNMEMKNELHIVYALAINSNWNSIVALQKYLNKYNLCICMQIFIMVRN